MSDETISPPLERDSPSGRHRILPQGAPRRIGRYQLFQMLGKGTFGRVYLAFDPTLERQVAIKVPVSQPETPTELPAAHRAFLREARVIADIHHPNICPVYDVGTQDDLPFIVMRYVRGGTLNDLLRYDTRYDTLTPFEALRFAAQVAKGLEAAHARGVIHRDLKPANVLYEEAADELLLADFGVARWLEQGTATSGGEKGTPAYMAPEQWGPDGSFGDISARTDVYSLGVLLFRMLTGFPLFEGSTFQLMKQHCDSPPRPPSSVRPDLDPRLDQLCARALRKAPEERYASAKDFADAITAVLDTLTAPVRAPSWRVAVPGVWYARGAEGGPAEWREVARTPGPISPRPNEVYRFVASAEVRDADLTGLPQLKSLATLQALDLGGCDQITDAGLQHLKALTALRTLDLGGCDNITDAGLQHLRALTGLHSVGLSRCDRITDAGLQHLKGFAALQALDLGGCARLTDGGLQQLTALAALRGLNLRLCKRVTSAGLQHLKSITGLRALNLGGCESVTDAGLQHLGALTAVQTLDLSRCHQITDTGLQYLKALTELQALDLEGCHRLTDAALVHLKAGLQLRKLTLRDCTRLTDAGLEALASLTTLQVLDLGGCDQITDAGLRQLNGLALQTLNLRPCTRLTDAGLEILASFTTLKTLDLGGCERITDRGLRHLKGLAALRSLDLGGCDGITDAGAAAFRRSVPNCEVYR